MDASLREHGTEFNSNCSVAAVYDRLLFFMLDSRLISAVTDRRYSHFCDFAYDQDR
jgi:hypothetical protein